ncbi:MAG: HAMP domain-containing protein [Sphingobacteriia bacterium]|nr:HAMP domain-containing protein [Sphingobacteriia bacterium]NCC38580.1 HAMP domain-containing protein [Gammaproteobacteria bacterium]
MSWLGHLVPRSLFGRALVTLILAFGLYGAVSLAAVVYYALNPVAQRSASDLAAIMALSARTLQQLAPELRDEYRSRLLREYQVMLIDERPPANVNHYFFPYLRTFKLALEQRLGGPVEIVTSMMERERWFWVSFDNAGSTVWVGFPRSRVETRPLEGLSVIIAVAVLLILGTALILAGRITRPLHRLSAAAQEVASGQLPNALSESGPKELANLAHQFNIMSRRIRELIANRTLMVAGISHDLRTPLTRLRLALEMLPRESAPELITRMERDIEEMTALITQAIDFGKSMVAGHREETDLAALVGDLIDGHARVIWSGAPPCRARVDALALRRILSNLLENALRYSQGRVEIQLDCKDIGPELQVLDRGQGIPQSEREAVFRPYYRLEASRNRRTGGSGLGLAVAYQLALANGMELRLDARPGGGTIACVRLPTGVIVDKSSVDARPG